jgi:hypothetical protein
LTHAIKAPEIINFEEILLIDAVNDLKNSAKGLYSLVELYIQKDIKVFKKEIEKMKKLLKEKNLSM